jgi:hypothetical protein
VERLLLSEIDIGRFDFFIANENVIYDLFLKNVLKMFGFIISIKWSIFKLNCIIQEYYRIIELPFFFEEIPIFSIISI